MCPANDTFLTSSVDRTVRLWKVGEAGCAASLELPPTPAGTSSEGSSARVAFDSTGLVFAVTAALTEEGGGGDLGHRVHLYDARNYGEGPFAELKVSRSDLESAIRSHVGGGNTVSPDRVRELSGAEWTSVQFNQSGNQILIGAAMGMCVLLDGFEGTIQRVFVEPASLSAETRRPSVCCYTPDDQTVLQGNLDGSITCWNVETGTVAQTLKGHVGPVQAIAANPRYCQFASACSQTALWSW